MKHAQPPALATWVLEHFASQANVEALAGDLREGYSEGKSRGWYWRQVLAAIRWRRHAVNFLGLAAFVAAALHWHLSGPVDLAMFTGLLLLSIYLPPVLSRRYRIILGLSVLLLWVMCWFFPLFPRPMAARLVSKFSLLPGLFILAGNLLSFYWDNLRQPPRFKMTYRELLRGDALEERKRLLARLEQTMYAETDPGLRHTYAQSIAILNKDKTIPDNHETES